MYVPVFSPWATRSRVANREVEVFPLVPAVDDRVTLVWTPHVVEQSVDSVQPRLDAVWDVSR